MTAMVPCSTSYDNTHMYSFVDYRPHDNPTICLNKNTVFEYIYNHPKLTKFAKILKKANQVAQYSRPELNITLFIPTDEYLSEPLEYYESIDPGTALNILAVSSLNNQIDGNLIRSSPVCNYITRDPYSYNTLYVTNISGVTKLNNCIKVIEFDVKLSNGIIHLTDGLVVPSNKHY